MIDPSIVTPVLVTRGDVSLQPVLDTLTPFFGDLVVIWNNAVREKDLKVYGHFAALAEVETEYVLTLDDDALCPISALLDAWKPEYEGSYLYNEKAGETPWISWGAIFHRDLPGPAIQRFVDAYGMSDDVLLWCDLIFAELTPHVNVDLGWENLPHCRAENRMVMKPTHYDEQARIRALCEPLK